MDDQRDYEKILISHPKIYNRSHTGGNKTTRAIQFIEGQTRKQRNVIVIMQSYDILEVAYLNKFSSLVKSRTIILKGRTQDGVCDFAKALSKFYEYTIPKVECNCGHETNCQYKENIERISDSDSTGYGIVILTTPKLLYYALSIIDSSIPTIIIDDVPFSEVVCNNVNILNGNLDHLIQYCNDNNLPNLSTISTLAKKQDISGIRSLYNCYNTSIKDEFDRLNNILLHQDFASVFNASTKILPKFHILHLIDNAINGNEDIQLYEPQIPNTGFELKIFSINRSLSNYSLIYLNASRTSEDDFYLNRIDKHWYKIETDATPNPIFVLLAINDASYSQATICDHNSKFADKVIEIVEQLDIYFKFLNQEVIFFTHSRSYDEKFSNSRLNRTNHKFVPFRSDKSKATNEFIDTPISVIVGTPYLPPDYFISPPFELEWKPSSDIIKEVEDNKTKPYKNPIYPVNREISDNCAIEHLIQVVGRTFRKKNNGPERKKLVILFSNLDIKNALFQQNGCEYLSFKIRSQTSRNGFYTQLEREIKKVLFPLIFDKIIDDIKIRLESDDHVKLYEYCVEVSKQLDGKIGFKTIEREIKSRLHDYIQKMPVGFNNRNILVIKKPNLPCFDDNDTILKPIQSLEGE
jgi:hypothetical protein